MKINPKVHAIAVFLTLLVIHARGGATGAQTAAARMRPPSTETAQVLLRAALNAMGGEERLRALKSLKVEGVGHTNLLEQSERPEGPWIVSYQQSTELRDLKDGKMRLTTEESVFGSPRRAGVTLIVADGVAALERDGRAFPGSPAQAQDAEERLALAPERVLLTALGSADLSREGKAVLQGVAQNVLKFTWRSVPVTIFINAYTNLPTAVETIRARPSDHWAVWGDVRARTYLSLWTLEPGGIRYPRQWDEERNGTPFRAFTVIDLTPNALLPSDAFNIAENTRNAFAARKPTTIDGLPLGRPDRPARELAQGVIHIPGRWDVALVRQADGVIVIEAPISSRYSAKVIAEVERRFPGVPVKGVISTSDAFPHIGGVREYVARGIPVYALDLNRPLLQRLINAPHTLNPDALARTPRKPKFNIVTEKTVIGAGANRLELYPVRGEGGERMVMVYLPEHRLLYGSDLVIKQPDNKFFMPQYLSELEDAVSREKLIVDNVFAMHTNVTPWSEVKKAIATAATQGG